MKKIVMLLVMLLVGFTYAQKERSLELNKETNLIEVVYYNDNGGVSQTGFYTLDGKLQGEWLSYSKDGKKIVSAKYNNGAKVGKWFYWSDDKLKEVDYSNNSIVSVNEWKNSKTILASNR
jgi:antitoxin component YwqK of YwqJK toxin-antitoxin module